MVKYFIICIFLFIISYFALCNEICNSVSNPQAYKDCSPYDDKQKSEVCCWIRGVYVGNNGTACLSVDELFKGRVVTYTQNGLTGSMICGDQTSNGEFIGFSFQIYLIFMILYLLL